MNKKKLALSSLAALAATFVLIPSGFAADLTGAMVSGAKDIAKDQATADFVTNIAIGQYKAIGAALAISLAAIGGALGQGRAAAAALEGIARNPGASGQLFTPMILGLALIESLVIYALIIAFLLLP